MLDKRKAVKICGKDWEQIKTETINKEEYEKYFNKYYELPQGYLHSAFNLGIYYNKKDELKASEYVGVMPLLKKNEYEEKNKKYIELIPRFGGSAIKMLEYVLGSDDIYENPESIKIKEFEIKELESETNRSKDKKDKVLFGTIKDIGEIEISKSEKGNGNDINFTDMISIFEIWDFISKARIVCQRMLKNQFQKTEENFTGKVKGKIDIKKQISKNILYGRIDRTYCVYNKLSIDNTDNRILKYALHLCQRQMNELGEIDKLNEDIAYCNRILSPVKFLKCTLSDFGGIKNNGVFKYYKPAMEAAKKIIKRISISFEDSSKVEIETSSKVKPFFIDMNLLFELYCRALVREAIKGEGYYLVKYENKYEIFKGKDNVPSGFIRELKPDIVIRERGNRASGDGNIIVIDAKYSGLNNYNREKTHQIMAYMTLLDCNYGGFISPKENKTKEDIKPSSMNLGNKFGFHIDVDISNIKDVKLDVKRIKKFIKNTIKEDNGGDSIGK